MSEAWRALGGRRRYLARQVYARDRATPGYVCPVCTHEIDWHLPYRDPTTDAVNVKSKSVDHATELQDGGAMLDLDNCWSAHLGCNASKGAARRHERVRAHRAPRTMAVIAIDPHTV
ncbi:HNH endonuclease [Micromonospora sp. NBC_00821]|uniref:hypothetical protein n=1 Tax=Micromonospora sp. NBC_00821 TaxID=2975977 RepID=UPI002ED0F7CF|nr:HNH endonuclease [Micromonospora sp. NBC_00821]